MDNILFVRSCELPGMAIVSVSPPLLLNPAEVGIAVIPADELRRASSVLGWADAFALEVQLISVGSRVNGGNGEGFPSRDVCRGT